MILKPTLPAVVWLTCNLILRKKAHDLESRRVEVQSLGSEYRPRGSQNHTRDGSHHQVFWERVTSEARISNYSEIHEEIRGPKVGVALDGISRSVRDEHSVQGRLWSAPRKSRAISPFQSHCEVFHISYERVACW